MVIKMDYLKNLFEGNETCLNDKEFNPYFVTLYCSHDPNLRAHAKVFNKMLFKVNDKLLKKIMFATLPKARTFYWSKHYVKTNSKTQTSFAQKLCKHYGWSSAEYEKNKKTIFAMPNLLEYYAKGVGLTNKEREEIELQKVVQPKFKKEKLKPIEIKRWMV